MLTSLPRIFSPMHLQKHMSAFSASKYALYGLTEALRAEVAQDNIHVGQVRSDRAPLHAQNVAAARLAGDDGDLCQGLSKPQAAAIYMTEYALSDGQAGVKRKGGGLGN